VKTPTKRQPHGCGLFPVRHFLFTNNVESKKWLLTVTNKARAGSAELFWRGEGYAGGARGVLTMSADSSAKNEVSGSANLAISSGAFI
jgi:hypothetical protein